MLKFKQFWHNRTESECRETEGLSFCLPFIVMNPSQRTLNQLRKDGYIAEVVERWIPQAKKRKDLFGFIDVVAIHPYQNGILGVQSTTGSHINARRYKLYDDQDLLKTMIVWLKANNHLEIHGWRQLIQKNKDGKPSKRKKWIPAIYTFSLKELEEKLADVERQNNTASNCVFTEIRE
jgi:DNA-binding transcriptional MerR regulator